MSIQLHQALVAEIKKTFPKNSLMVNALSEILRIDRGAVYRRLRQEVPFTFNEIAIIAKQLNISVDNLIGENHQTIPFQLRLPNYDSPQDSDFYVLDIFIKFLESFNQSEFSETATVSNVLPHDLFGEFRHLLLFYLFVWNYHYNSTNVKIKSYHQVSILPKLEETLNEYMMEMKKFDKTCYVLDGRMFKLFVDRVGYFHSIRLIEKEDVLKIKEDLFSMLDYLEKIAITGQFKETGNAASIYISDIDITTSYTYLEAKNMHFSMVKAFILSYVTSFDDNTFDKMKKWIQSLIKISTLITLTNEKQRVLYFEKQRKIISEL